MDINQTPLNKAHQLERRAEVLNRQKRFDECIECHKKAVEFLNECLKLTQNPVSLESISFQKEWNKKQIKTIQLKKSYLERSERERNITNASKTVQNDVKNLEQKIFRTIETHDSLICYLGQRENSTKHCPHKKEDGKEASPPIIGNKHPKDDSTVIEELKVLSGQLRESVHGLLIQLDDRNKEIEKLRHTIKALELENSKDNSKTNYSNLRAIDSSGGTTSPYVFSPCTELSPEPISDLRTLPPLEPLQMPNFDFRNLRDLNSN